MNKKEEKVPVMDKIAGFIVDKRNLFFLIYIAAIVFSVFSSSWVNVNNDLSSYLPSDTETRQGLTLMEDEFVTFATARVMVINVSYSEAENNIKPEIENVDGVRSVDFDRSKEHYKDTCALFDVTLDSETGEQETQDTYARIGEALQGYDVYISQSDVDASARLAGEMNIIFAVAAVIILGVLLFTSHTYMEIPVMLITFVSAMILNNGTNFIFGEISFISNSVTAILQLALSIDYAIILIHRYTEERENLELREAVVQALSKSIIEISASSLTTISGLTALMFMKFGIGFDMGINLIKSIFFSLLTVFTLMPGLLMLLGKYIDKTHHKNFVPKISALGKIVAKLRFIVPPVFLVIIIIAYFLSSNCPFAFGTAVLSTNRKSETQIAQEMVDEHFGSENSAALLIPAGDYEKEGQIVRLLESRPEINSVTALSNIVAKDDYVLTDKLNPRQFSELVDIDIEVADLLYAVYATDKENYAKLINGLDEYGVPLIDMFMFLCKMKDEGYVELDAELSDELDDMYSRLNDAKMQLSGENYSRIVLDLNLPEEGSDTFAFLDEIHNITEKYYNDVYIVGNSTSDYDLSKSFATDNIIISILTVLFVIIVLLFTFKSVGLPILLIAVIQGSIWINFSVPFITSSPLFFLSYLVVSSIQMGANIDYAIVISGRYLELKKELAPKKAITQALNLAFPTVLTSGTILAASGFLISFISTIPEIVSIGTCLCRGTLTSMFLVMCVLPEILLLGDQIIERTSFNLRKGDLVTSDRGIFLLKGRVRGYINGFIDAEIQGVLRGEIKAQISMDNIEKQVEKGDVDDEEDEE